MPQLQLWRDFCYGLYMRAYTAVAAVGLMPFVARAAFELRAKRCDDDLQRQMFGVG